MFDKQDIDEIKRIVGELTRSDSRKAVTDAPAFPVVTGTDTRNVPPGMSLRDYFAGQVIVGLSARGLASEEAARIAYRNADAMLRVREAGHD